MRVLRCFVAAALLTGLAAPALADAHESDLMKEVAAIGDKLAAMMEANDFDAALEYYTEDAISLPNFGPRLQGMDEFRAHNEMMSQAGMKILSFESEPTEAWEAGDQVIEIGTYKISLEMPGAPAQIDDHGKYLTIYERDADGALKIKVETWNTDMNPMQMMGGGGGAHGHGDEADSDSDSESDSDSDSEEEEPSDEDYGDDDG